MLVPVFLQIWVHGESTESQLIAFVVPTKAFIEEHGGEGNLGSKEVRAGGTRGAGWMDRGGVECAHCVGQSFHPRPLPTPPSENQAEKAMLELLKNAAKKHNLKGFEMIRAVHLDKEPWTCVFLFFGWGD